MTVRATAPLSSAPLLARAALLFAVLVAFEIAWGRWAPPYLPAGIAGSLILTASARIVDLLLVWGGCRVWSISRDQLGLGRDVRLEGIRTGVRWTVILGIAAGGLLVVYRIATGRLPDPFSSRGSVFRLPWPGLPSLFLLSVLGPFVEEVVFRGLLYRALRRHVPLASAVGLSAMLFALVHGPDPRRFLPAAAGAVLFCLALERSGSLWAPFILHGSGNLFLWLYGFVLR